MMIFLSLALMCTTERPRIKLSMSFIFWILFPSFIFYSLPLHYLFSFLSFLLFMSIYVGRLLQRCVRLEINTLTSITLRSDLKHLEKSFWSKRARIIWPPWWKRYFSYNLLLFPCLLLYLTCECFFAIKCVLIFLILGVARNKKDAQQLAFLSWRCWRGHVRPGKLGPYTSSLFFFIYLYFILFFVWIFCVGHSRQVVTGGEPPSPFFFNLFICLFIC